MVNTRNQCEASASQQHEAHPEHEAPPPPTLAQAITVLLDNRNQQTELMRLIADNTSRPGGRQAHQGPPQNSTYRDFLVTHLPVFTEAAEPLEADYWLRTVEAKFGLIRYTEHQKTLYAVQQLQGSAGTWWANYIASRPQGHQVP
jgi:hypothetical protein